MFQAVAWLLAGAIVALSLTPPSVRPSTGASHGLENAASCLGVALSYSFLKLTCPRLGISRENNAGWRASLRVRQRSSNTAQFVREHVCQGMRLGSSANAGCRERRNIISLT